MNLLIALHGVAVVVDTFEVLVEELVVKGIVVVLDVEVTGIVLDVKGIEILEEVELEIKLVVVLVKGVVVAKKFKN